MKFTKGGHLSPGSKQMPPFVGRGGQLPSHQAPHFGGNAVDSKSGAHRAVSTAKAATAVKVKAHIRLREQVPETPPMQSGNALAMARKSQ